MFCLHIKESCYMFRFQQLYYALQVIRYYVHQYETYMFKKLMKSFQHELFIRKSYPQRLFCYHAFMHTVKSSCHASLTEQSGLLRLQEHFFCAAKSLSMEEQFCCIQKLVLDVLSFCVYIVEEIYMFKQSSAVLKLFCPHIDVFCIQL